MKVIGTILVVIGIAALLTGSNQASPGTDPAEALGQALGPFLFLGLGCFLLWKDAQKAVR
jgi:hypothetical protein